MPNAPKKIWRNHQKWFIWSLAASFFFIEYMAKVAPATMEPQLMHDFAINAQQYGLLSAFFYYAYVAMQLPVGTLFDRFQPVLLMGLMVLLCATGCYLFAATHNLLFAQIARLITGVGGAFAFIGSIKLITIWFPAHYLGMLTGATQALGMLGAAIGESLTAYSTNHLGWRLSIIIIGHTLTLLGLLFLVTYHWTKKTTPTPTKHQQKTNTIMSGLTCILTNPMCWLNGLYAGLIFAPTGAFSEVWGPTYLTHVQHLTPQMAAITNVFVFLGWGLGGPIIGHLSDKLKKRKPIMIYSAIICFILLTIILYVPHLALHTLLMLLFLYGVANTGLIASYATATEITPKHNSGVAIAFANMASVIIGVFFLPIIGMILDAYWQGTIQHGIRTYSIHAYHMAMLALPLCLLASAVLACFIKETHCRNLYD
jgi:MFS family permease